jgi:hypothetical protein
MPAQSIKKRRTLRHDSKTGKAIPAPLKSHSKTVKSFTPAKKTVFNGSSSFSPEKIK